MAAAAFSIRGFAASKRGELAAEGRLPLGIKALPPIEAPKFRWWADELASAVASAAAAPSSRRSAGKAKPPKKKKRSISDLFAAAPPLAVPPSDESGGNEQTEVEDDEALCAIARRAKEEKKRKRRLQEEEEEQEDEEAAAAAAASAEGSGWRETEGNFEATKEAPENSNLPHGLDRLPSQKPEASQHLREEMENISRRRKKGKITKKKKVDTEKCIDNNKADKLGKPRDLEKHLPRQSILKIKRTSVKMVKEKCGNSKGKEVIELCRKSVKRVKFSEADDILGSEMQGCELPKRRSLSELFSDAMTSSSSSSSSSSVSSEGDKCITSESSFHMPKEAVTKTKEANLDSNHEDSPTEGDKCRTAESSSSHMPKEAVTETKEANLDSNHEDSPTEGDKCRTAERRSSHMPKEAVTETKEANLNSNWEDTPTEGDKCRTAESRSSHMPKEAVTETKEANLNSNWEDTPTEGDKCRTAESRSSHIPKEAVTETKEVSLNSNWEDTPTEGDKCRTAESRSSHMPKEAVTETKEANLNSNWEDTPTEGDKCRTAESRSSHMPKEAVTETKEVSLNSNWEDTPTEGDKCRTAESRSSHMPKVAFAKTKEVSLNSNHEDSSTEGHKRGPVESSSHMPKEAFTKNEEINLNSNHDDSPSEGGKCRTAEISSSHMPKEAFTKTKEANLNSNHEDFPMPSNTELPSPLLDLNEALPESTDLNYTYNSNPEVPYLEQAHEESLNSDVHLLDGREHQRNLYFDSHRLASQLPAADPGSARNARSAGTLLQAGGQVKVSGVDIVDPALSLREQGETHRDCSNVSVEDAMTTSMSPCALPGHTFQDSFQQNQNVFHTNLNHGDSQLSTGGKFRSWSSRELSVQRDCSPSMGQTLRLMGKDLAVCTTRGEMSAETREKHTGTSTNDYRKTNTVLELPRQGKPFLSLKAQSFPNVTVNSTSTIHASTYHASTSQAHVGYRTPNDFSHPIPAANVFSGDRLPYESRVINFSNSQQPTQPFLLGCPPLPNNRSTALHQNPLPPWGYYSDPISRTEPPTAQFWPTTRQHGTPSSVFRGSLPQQHIVHSASSSGRPLTPVSSTFSHPARVVQQASNSIRDAALSSGRPHTPVSSTFSHPARVVQEASNSTRDAALSSRNSENRMRRAVPGNSNASSSGRYVQKRSGPVKLTPGAKHILVPSDSTGDGDSVPVYSCVSFGSRSGNASASQNKGV